MRPGISTRRDKIDRDANEVIEHHSLVFNVTAFVATGSNQDRFSFLSRTLREPETDLACATSLERRDSLAIHLTSRAVLENNQHY